jgi:hypothetical protein
MQPILHVCAILPFIQPAYWLYLVGRVKLKCFPNLQSSDRCLVNERPKQEVGHVEERDNCHTPPNPELIDVRYTFGRVLD